MKNTSSESSNGSTLQAERPPTTPHPDRAKYNQRRAQKRIRISFLKDRIFGSDSEVMNIRTFRLVLGLVLSLLPGSVAHGATISWQKAADGNWSDAAAWSSGTVPGAGDSLLITLSGTYAVTINANASAGNLRLGGASGTQTLTIAGGALSQTTFTLLGSGTVGANAVFDLLGVGLFRQAGNLIVNGGALVLDGSGSISSHMEVAAGSSIVFGGNYSWNSSATFAGAGSFHVDPVTPCCSVTANGNLAIPNLVVGIFGALTVASGTLRVAGGSSAGTITAASGATVNFTGNYDWTPGATFAGAGSFRVDPVTPCCSVTANGNMTIPNLVVGNFGALTVASGTLSVAGGSSAGTITVASGAAVNFTGSYSWNAGAKFAGTGSFRVDPVAPCCNVTANGNMTIPDLVVGNFGALTVASGTLSLAGGSSAGTITVASGAAVNFTGNYVWSPGATFAGPGSFRVDPGTPCCNVTANGNLTFPNLVVGNFGALTVASGTLSLAGGSSAGTITVADGAAVNFTGNFIWNPGATFAGPGSFHVDPATPCCNVTANGSITIPNLVVGSFGALNVANGTLTMDGGGNSAGRLGIALGAAVNVLGDFSSSASSVLDVLLGGLTPGTQYTQFPMTGAASLGGTLNIQLVNGFVPALSNSFQLMSYSSRNGTFSHVGGQNLGNGLFLNPVYQANGLVLIVLDAKAHLEVSSAGFTNGEFHLRFSGAAGMTYVTEASTNLTAWA